MVDADKLDPKAFDSLAQRFFRAEWITGRNIVSADEFSFRYTEGGLARFAELSRIAGIWRKEENGFLHRNVAYFHFEWRLMMTMRELMPPPFSPEEKKWFRNLALHFVAKHGHKFEDTPR
jgi:hypothetical protein